MKKFIVGGLLTATTLFSWAQTSKPGISASEASRIENILASDAMQGRRVFTPGIEKAADFIASEFRDIGLRTWDGGNSYRQTFTLVRPRFIGASGVWDGQPVEAKHIVVITCQPELKIDAASGYETVNIPAGANLVREAGKLLTLQKNTLVLVDESHAADFARLTRFKRTIPKTDKSLVFVLTNIPPKQFTIEARHEITEEKLSNVVGVLPGRSKKEEYVIFSAHYDHLGTGKPVNGDSIYNGANDDASGTTAVMMLARYFREKNLHERTLVFVAFTGEEAGGLGSKYFSQQLDPDKIAAMINIEMIGTLSKWGKNSAYITGYEKSDLGAILQKNLAGSPFTFQPDPYPAQQLFYRSDNATLARLGVPAHTISTSTMDNEPHYHKVSDHAETLDMENMAMIIRSIAISASGIVAGTDTPSRVKPEELR